MFERMVGILVARSEHALSVSRGRSGRSGAAAAVAARAAKEPAVDRKEERIAKRIVFLQRL